MRSISESRLLTAVIVVACSVVAVSARADDHAADADRLFDLARAHMKRGDFGAARESLAESLRLERTVGVLFNLALCEDKLGLLGDSFEHLRAAIDLAESDDRRRPLLDALMTALEPRVPHLVLKLDANQPRGLELSVDARRIDAAAGLDLRVNPGQHQLTIRGPGRLPETVDVHLNEGESFAKTIVWNRPAASFGPEGASNPRTERSSHALAPNATQQAGAVALTAGGVGVVTGAVLGFMALGRQVVVDHHCGTNGCDAEGSQASREGKAIATASTITAAGGFVGLALGGYLAFGPGTSVADRFSMTDRYAGYIGAAVGAAGLAVSAGAAFTALSAQREQADLCSAGACQDQQAVDAAARGGTASTVATIAFGVGVAGVGVASYSLLLRPTFKGATDVRMTLSPSSIAWSARF